jgi:nucleotide-binding universal stress UspA family protein
MSSFKKVLYPVSLTEITPKVAKYAREVIKEFGAEVHLMFVILSISQRERVHIKYAVPRDFNEQAMAQAETALEKFRDEHLADLPNCKLVVKCGDVAEEILDYAKSEGVDLITMGTHGRRGVSQVFLGSVAASVLQRTPVPVFIVNPFTVSD